MDIRFTWFVQIDVLRRTISADEMNIKMANAAKEELRKQTKNKMAK